MRHDEGALFSVQGVTDREGFPTDVAMGRKVRWINALAQEELIPPWYFMLMENLPSVSS